MRVGRTVRIRVTRGEPDAAGICRARVYHDRRKVEEFETTPAEFTALCFEIRGRTVPQKVAAAAQAAQEAREEAGRTFHWRLVAAIRLTAPLGPPQPAF
ncbi:MAG TPA: hypothetical protein VLL76_05865 [Candidatus Omnitrophota bacterium]|nr:hypothetical protein [Candidatus Omnitrophota bacterium]